MAQRDHGGLIEAELTGSIIAGFYKVYNTLGTGFSEHVYSAPLARELMLRGHGVRREHLVAVYYEGEIVTYQRVDMLVDDKAVVENKVTDHRAAEAEAQAYNYLKCTQLQVGLVLFFTFRPRFRRVVHSPELKQFPAKDSAFS